MYDGETVIYSDILFLINFCIDFLCLFISGRLLHRFPKWYRLALGAALGGAYAFVPYLFEFGLPLAVALHLIAAGIIVVCTFGVGDFKKTAMLFLTFMVTEALIGGLVSAFYGMAYSYGESRYAEFSPSSLVVICALSAAIALSYGFVARKKIDTRSVAVTLILGNEKTRINLLCDSGNLVTEPFSALPVIVVAASCLPFPFDTPESEIFPLPIRAIPFSTSSGQSCFLGFRPERILLTLPLKKTKAIDAYVAVDTARSSYSGYDGLFPTCLL